MVFDFKKSEKGLHLPPTVPSIATVPPMNFLTIRDQGDQNEKNGAYSNALALLYAVALH